MLMTISSPSIAWSISNIILGIKGSTANQTEATEAAEAYAFYIRPDLFLVKLYKSYW